MPKLDEPPEMCVFLILLLYFVFCLFCFFTACFISSKGSKSCQWISSSRRLAEGKLQFEMSHDLSPYAEESTMLELTAEAIRDLSVFRTSKRFYLRDIGKLSKTELHQWHSVEDYQLESTFSFLKTFSDEKESPCMQSMHDKVLSETVTLMH